MFILITKKFFSEKKLISKINFALLLFILAIAFFSLNNEKNVFANDLNNGEGDNEELVDLKLDCGKEIPLGEAMEKTHDLSYNPIQELESIYDNANYQIAAAEQAVSLANQCDISVCKPVDCGSYQTSYSCGPCLEYHPENPLICIKWNTCYRDHCHSPKTCDGQVCPQSSINSEFGKVQSAYNSIESSRNRIFDFDLIDLIEEKSELLCDKLNEDIRGGIRCSSSCLENPDGSDCPKISTTEAIRRKLYLSRNEFDKCYIPQSEWIKVQRGEISGKFLSSCPSVIGKTLFTYYTKTTTGEEENEKAVCTSLHNFFCCFDAGLESLFATCIWSPGNTCPAGTEERSYDFCGNRPVPLMTCCCPDFDLVRTGPGPGPGPGPDPSLPCVPENSSPSSFADNAKDICLLTGIIQFGLCGNRDENIHPQSQCCGRFDENNEAKYWWVEPNICLTDIGGTFNGNSAWANHALNEIRNSNLMNVNVSDASDFFPGGNITEARWVRLLSEIARHESNYNPNTTYTESFKNSKGEYVISTGLFQLSYESVSGYGFPGLTTNDLKDPILNITIAVKILERWVVSDNCIACRLSGAWQGGARYWSVLRPPKVSEIKSALQ